MPKRVIDFDAMWASDKIAACADWAQAEYAWLYGLADASGCFELTNLRVIWGRVSAIRKDFSLDRLAKIFDEFIAHGLLFTWEENGKRYAHWTGSDVPGRLPAPSWRARLERLAPAIPRGELGAYTARFAARRRVPALPDASSHAADIHPVGPAPLGAFDDRQNYCGTSHAAADTEEIFVAASRGKVKCEAPAPDADCVFVQDAQRYSDPQLKPCLEVPQVQDLNLNEKKDWGNTQVSTRPVFSPHVDDRQNKPNEETDGPAQLLAIYEMERGALPPAERLTSERRRHCRLRLAAGLSTAEFRTAVQRAARTPFLAGAGDRGWRASFDWFLANDTNIRKVLEGCYDSPGSFADGLSDVGSLYRPPSAAPLPTTRGFRNDQSLSIPAALYAGLGPQASASGARVKPAALERIRARNEASQMSLDVENAGVGKLQDDAAESECGRKDHFAAPTDSDAPAPACEPVRADRQRSIRDEKAS